MTVAAAYRMPDSYGLTGCITTWRAPGEKDLAGEDRFTRCRRDCHRDPPVARLRDTPRSAPVLALEEWREFLGLLRPHGIHALLAYRLGAWPGADGQMKAIRLYSGP